jgi:hypothetical protein
MAKISDPLRPAISLPTRRLVGSALSNGFVRIAQVQQLGVRSAGKETNVAFSATPHAKHRHSKSVGRTARWNSEVGNQLAGARRGNRSSGCQHRVF